MRLDNPDLIDRLAAEYVLGTLHGSARKRFDTIAKYRRDIQLRISYWEAKTADLALQLEPESPPASLWERILNTISTANLETRATQIYAKRIRFWQTWSGLTSTVAIATIVFAFMITGETPNNQDSLTVDTTTETPMLFKHVGLAGDSDKPLWVISADLETGQIRARAINAQARNLDEAFELWMLPQEGPPQSIGLLPVDGQQLTLKLTAGLSRLLEQSKGLAISVEPPGGSPTGLPTGEVIETLNIWEI